MRLPLSWTVFIGPVRVALIRSELYNKNYYIKFCVNWSYDLARRRRKFLDIDYLSYKIFESNGFDRIYLKICVLCQNFSKYVQICVLSFLCPWWGAWPRQNPSELSNFWSSSKKSAVMSLFFWHQHFFNPRSANFSEWKYQIQINSQKL